jgi:molecular chaperone DnaK (HSP70)
MVKGSVVMVLDCGGGTVDITVHRLKCEPDE